MHHVIVRLFMVSAAVIIAGADSSCTRQAASRRHLDRANHHFSAGQYDQAEIEYKNTLQLDPSVGVAFGRLGVIFADDGRPGQALPALRRARELIPENLEFRTKLGVTLLNLGDVSSARREAEFVLSRDPQNPDAAILLADAVSGPPDVIEAQQRIGALPASARAKPAVLVALGQLELRAHHAAKAEALFTRALAADPKSPYALAATAMMHWAQRDVTAADREFKKAAELSPLRSPRRLQYVQFKVQTGGIDEAKRLLDEMNRQTPDYLPGWLWRSEIALNERKFDDAEALASRAFARDSLHPETILLVARVQMAKGNIDGAISELERMTGLYPQSPLAYYQLGTAYVGKGEISKSRDALTRAVMLAPQFTAAVISLAELDVRAGSLKAAVKALTPVVQQNPNLAPARMLLADAYQQEGNLGAALALYDELERQIPDNYRIPFGRAVILRQQGKIDAARAAFAKAAQLSNDSFVPLEQLVNLELAVKDFTAAREHAQHAATQNPKSAGPHLILARVYMAQSDATAAESELKQAIALQPDSAGAYVMLARMYVSRNEHAKAVQNLRELMSKNPSDIGALTLLAMIYQVQNQFNPARDTYENLLKLDPNSPIALNNLAYLYSEELGDLNRAVELARRAHASLPDDPRSTDTLGWVLYRRRQYTQAMPLLQSAAGKMPDEAEARYHLGMAYYMLGEEAEARVTLEAALKQEATFHGAEDARHHVAILAIDPATASIADRVQVQRYAATDSHDPGLNCRLATWYRQEGKLENARQTAEAALQASPAHRGALLLVAQIAADEGQLSKAIELAKNARTAAPDSGEIGHLLGRLAYQNRDYQWAASLLREAATRLPLNADVHMDEALSAYSVGDIAAATAAATRALELDPTFARAADAREFLDLLSVVSAPDANAQAARVAAALQVDPGNVPALMASAALSEARGDLTAAQHAYEKVLETYPDFSPAQRSLVISLAQRPGDLDKAASLAIRARQAYPSDSSLAKAYGVIVFRQGDFQRATTLLQESAMTRSSDAEVLYYLGMSQYELKRRPESKRNLQRALELGLQGELAAKARTSLETPN
jgi:tetratricopeptide (TPR) repeat protein